VNTLAAPAFKETSVFSPQLLYPVSSAATTEYADVLARRERYLTASLPEPKPIDVVFHIGDQAFLLTYRDAGNGLPPWAPSVLRSLSERWGLEQGWDSYDARPTDLQRAVELLNYLSALLSETSIPPIITPLSDGGVQAEWHRNKQDLEIVVPVNQPARYYYFNVTAGKEEDEELGPEKLAHVRALIAEI
jgi:hypothetical protein